MLTICSATRSTRSSRRFTLKVGGFILAGGRSSRFGSNKATSKFGAEQLIDRVVSALRPHVDHITIVGGDAHVAKSRGVSHLEDAVVHEGPWVAIEGVAQRCSVDVFLFAPCDLPLLTSASVGILRQTAIGRGVAVLASDEMAHWSVSGWTRERLLAAVEMARETGARSLHGAIEPLKPAHIRVPSSEMVNVNTQDDLAEAEQHLAHWKDD